MYIVPGLQPTTAGHENKLNIILERKLFRKMYDPVYNRLIPKRGREGQSIRSKN